MRKYQQAKWQELTITPEDVMSKLEPGMSIFLGTGVGEPRTLVKHLMALHSSNLKDLELIQLVSLGDAISLEALNTNAYRLKTFYSGWVASDAITAGRVDLIPSSFSRIPGLIEAGRIPIDVAFVQITPPDEAGYCSLGVAVDVGRQAMDQAKKEKIIYADQIFIEESAHLYPSEINLQHIFKGDLKVRFRAIRPSDEEEMRRLFYRFSDQSVYYRYFAPIKTMPHAKMQGYVNIDFSRVMSIVGVVGESGQGHIIAEARFVRNAKGPCADVAFVVDEEHQGIGIATYLYKLLIRLAKDRGLLYLTADVLATNKGMMKVFEKDGAPVTAKLDYGVYHLTIPLGSDGV